MKVSINSGSVNATLEVSEDACVHQVEAAGANIIGTGLSSPIALPPLHECVVPGDNVTIVVDPETPQVVDVINAVWEQFQSNSVTDLHCTLLLPPDNIGNNWKALVDVLPVSVTGQMVVDVYDPADENQRRYLASSAAGERVYLAHHIIDADLIVTIGVIGFDALFGYRGTNSGIYPAFSDVAALKAAEAMRHVELEPDAKRPLRELTDEVGWLLGTQFTVQVIPNSHGQIAQVLCGAPEEVFNEGREFATRHWKLQVEDTFELAVISIPRSLPQLGWKQFGAAVASATRLVEDGGRLAVVAELPIPDSPAFGMLRRCNEPGDLLKPLRLEPTYDAVELTQLINALQHCSVFLLSNLDDSVVEELGMLALSSEGELQRMIAAANSVAVVPSANYAWANVGV